MNGEAYCRFIKPDGSRCQARPLTTGAHCFFHAPTASRDRRQAQQRGGRNRRAVLPLDMPRPSLATPRDVAAFLGETLDQVRKGQLDPKVAQALASLCSVLLKALTNSELERLAAEIDEMQQAVKQRRQEEAARQAVAFDDDAGGDKCPSLDDFETKDEDREPPYGGDLPRPYADSASCRNGGGPLPASDLDLWR